MQWTDRIRNVKLLLVLSAMFIAVGSLFVSHFLVRDLSAEERNKMEVWAEAMRTLNAADENTDLTLVLKVINENNTIPVIVIDNKSNVQTFRNVPTDATDISDLKLKAQNWLRHGQYIKIGVNEDGSGQEFYVCYDDSLMLKRLAYYPYVQLLVMLVFVAIAIFALLAFKRSEQNKVWVGLSKETAHQLGTPISSLMAWTEVLKESYPEDDLIPEMDKDVQRLQLIADRFSKIGSLPEPVPTSLTEIIDNVIQYMDRRTSRTVEIRKFFPHDDIIVDLCPQLFEWVIENLCKNAVDAMGGKNGKITITVTITDGIAAVEVADTGKGIKKRDIGNVFKPGFTTKKRGWGLGLSLAKRIVDEYHKGRIFVKCSEVGKGTTFRIELRI